MRSRTDAVVVVKRLDGVHVAVGHLGRSVDGHALKRDIALAIGIVVVGGRDGAVGFLGHGLVGRVKVHFAVNAGAVEPKRHVDTLDLVDVVAGDKALGQQDLALVVFLECGRDVVAPELKRNHQVGREVARELAGRHGGVAAVRAGGDGDGAVGHELGAARRADVAGVLGELLHRVVGEGLWRCGCRIGFGVGLVLALAIEGLDFFDFKARVTVVADELLLGACKM